MSTKYKFSDEIPSSILVERLKVLSDACTKDRSVLLREFTMSIPAECDRDADLVLSSSAKRITELESELATERAARELAEAKLDKLAINFGDDYKP